MADLPAEFQQKLSKLREEYKSTDSIEDLDLLEKQIQTLVASREFLDLPVFKDFAALAQGRIKGFNARLLNDEELLNDEGRLIKRERDIWTTIIRAFGADANDAALESLMELMDSKLPTDD